MSQLDDRLSKTLTKALTTEWGGQMMYLECYNQRILTDAAPCIQAEANRHNHDFIVETYEYIHTADC